MGPSTCWSLLTAVLIPLYMGYQCHGKCTEEKIDIVGGVYTLTNGLNDGSILIYQCPSDYFPYPTFTRQCSAHGQWSPPPKRKQTAECRLRTCPDPLVLENGSVTPNQQKYFVNNKTTYDCFSGSKLRGSSSRVCQSNGKWSGSTPICSHDGSGECSDPGIPAGTTRDGHVFGIDDKVTYHCNDNLKLIGSKERVCREGGQWTGVEPQCYYQYTYDTLDEVKEAFGSALATSLSVSEVGDNSTQGQFGRKFQVDKGGLLNIYIAVDISESIDENHIRESVKAIIKLIEVISFYPVSPNYEILFFATVVEEIVNIMDFYKEPRISLENIIQKLNGFNYKDRVGNTGTNIGLALYTIQERLSLVKIANKKHYNDIHHVIILFTDGNFNMGGTPLPKLEQIKEMVYAGDPVKRDEYLDIYAFGLGDNLDRTYLNQLVTKRQDETHLFQLKSAKDLAESFDQMIDEGNSVSLCGLHKESDSAQTTDDNIMSRRTFYPWLAVVSITRQTFQNSECMGSLVNNRFVLTAAHCFKFGDKVEEIQVEIGRFKGLAVEKYIPHPKFNITKKAGSGIKEFYDYDVALIKLKDNLMLSVDIRPICIPCTEETSGALRLSGVVTCKKHEEMLLKKDFEPVVFLTKTRKIVERRFASIKLGDRKESCVKDALKAEGITEKGVVLTRPEDLVTDNFLCTGGIEHKADHISCKGDSGGALHLDLPRMVQVGVISWGVKNLCETKSGMILSEEKTRDFHISLFKVKPFLEKHLGEEAVQREGGKPFSALKFLKND